MKRSPQPPGWYPDGPNVERWWDGEAWTNDTQAIEPAKGVAGAAAVDDPAPHVKRRWRPADFIMFGALGFIIFGIPGFTRSTGNDVIDTLLTIAGMVSAVWLVVGVISLAVHVGRRE